MGPRFRLILSVAAALSAIVPATGATIARSRLIVDPQTVFAVRVVAAHNRFRAAEMATPALWDASLAAAADGYAAELARTGRFAHSAAGSREGQGENLWMGTRNGFSFERMVEDWGSEKRMFRAGQFPSVSSTGRWEDVGHYTQIIWPTSVRVGCAVRSSAEWDYLVCRYGQGGNVFGDRVGMVGLAAR